MLADPRPSAEPLFREALSKARRLGRPILASWTRVVPPVDAIGFFAQGDATADRALWFRPDVSEAMVGLGAAHVFHGHGSQRFATIGGGWRDLLADSVLDTEGDIGPRLLGGFSFDPLRPRSRLWAGFPAGLMVLPQRMLVVRDGVSWLTTNVVVDAPPRLTQPADQQRPTPDQPVLPQRADQRQPTADWPEVPLAPERWQHLVGAVARGIAHKQVAVSKLVLARAPTVAVPRPAQPQTVLRRLADRYPTCTVFSVARHDAIFLGATPERLITLHRGQAATMALAGSIARGRTPVEDEMLARRLLADPKERTEHALVVEALRAGLVAGGSTRIVEAAEPRVKRLPNVQHLLTLIRAHVPAGTTVLDLVAGLHPTPAVGGYPREHALSLIRDHERLDRGWYAGPVGWLDASGDGEFVVAIRSALWRGEQATLFAGCGIVGDSQPAAEYAESRWKLRPMLAALGVAE